METRRDQALLKTFNSVLLQNLKKMSNDSKDINDRNLIPEAAYQEALKRSESDA